MAAQDSDNKRIPLVFQPEQRYYIPGVDSVMVNCYSEKTSDGNTHIYKRGGLTITQAGPQLVWGMAEWSGTTNTYPYAPTGTTIVIPTSVNTYGWNLQSSPPSLSVIAGTMGIGTVNFTGIVPTGFGTGSTCFFFYAGFNSGTNQYDHFAYMLNQGSSTITVATLASTPGPNLAFGGAVLDDTLYYMDTTGNIWGSNVDSTTFSALNVIVASDEPDAGIALTKQESFIIAFKARSIQVFEDAGSSPGSPLQGVPNTAIQYGCASRVINIGGDLYFIAVQKGTTLPSVGRLRGLKLDIISNPAIDRVLEAAGAELYSSVSTEPSVHTWQLTSGGHTFFGMTIASTVYAGAPVYATYVFDTKQNQWAKWTDANGNYLPIQWAVGNQAADFSGNIYTYQQYGVPNASLLFPVDIYTPIWDAGTRSRKFLQSLEIIGDQNQGNVIQLRRSDDDYKSWSNFRNVDMSRGRARLLSNGSFRRRAYHLHSYNNSPMRIESLEPRLLMGTN